MEVVEGAGAGSAEGWGCWQGEVVRRLTFRAVVPTAFDNFARVRLVLFDRGIGDQTDIVVDVKVEHRTRLAAVLVDDKIVCERAEAIGGVSLRG